ncbi:MAG: sigma 54-interacting transcriptional regulator, partial [Gemmatimonadota bacterium]|nr:sigma 54-interacting transcriptional regulator [Gemmatimonadota bacterium]
IITIDTNGKITSWNRAAGEITGRSSATMVGRNLSEAFADGSSGCGGCEPLDSGPQVSAEFTLLRPDGSAMRVLKNAAVLSDSSGNPAGTVICLTDLSILKSIELPAESTKTKGGEASPMPGMIGASESMRGVYRLIRFAAQSESTVLITGESGTGKELAAQAIHRLSRRSGGPFVAVNCSALPEGLLESELFGHVRGAFTGAVSNKTGRFELAGQGTIFLDEIGDISPLIQLKLLRVLQDHQYQRVGESTSRKADVRVIAATNRDLFQMVRKGEFREDLFFRLKVFPVVLPPLRERKTDIPALLDFFIESFGRKTGKRIERIHPEAMKLLLEYCWRGNVRELEHAVEYAFVLCKGPEIGPFELPQEILRLELRSRYCQPQGVEGAFPGALQPASNAGAPTTVDLQRHELLQALEQAGWNQSAAARLLGVSRVTVWNRMKKLGISRPGS